jgi:ribose transport system ATP-binding protein
MIMGKTVLEMRHINKSYSAVKVLRDVDITLHEGEILGLIGENGAGKSTLMRILSGGTQPDSGDILLDGRKIEIASPVIATHLKISMVQQELSLIPTLSVSDNIVLGHEFKKMGLLKILDTEKNRRYASDALKTVDLSVPLNTRVSKLSVANQQLIEIARNLIRQPRVFILDEPTTALTLVEAKELLTQMEALREKGTAIIFISHKLEEIMQVSDRMVVMRDGQKVGEVERNEVNRSDLIKLMVGDKEFFLRKERNDEEARNNEIVLEAKNLFKKDQTEDVSFVLRKGEVLGFFGLKGAGRSELFKSVFGAQNFDNGKLLFSGNPVQFKNPRQAIKAGMGFVTEDRKFSGIFPNMDVGNNILISDLKSVSNKLGFVKKKGITNVSMSLIAKLGIKTPSWEQRIRNLSGGNQQKVMISRWLHTNSKVLVLDEPTKGVDVGAKQDIYEQIHLLAREGKGIVVICSELEEVMLISDRVAVMREGRIEAILEGSEIQANNIMHYAAG